MQLGVNNSTVNAKLFSAQGFSTKLEKLREFFRIPIASGFAADQILWAAYSFAPRKPSTDGRGLQYGVGVPVSVLS